MLLDDFGSPTGPWKGGPPGGPLFLGRTNEGAVGILRITPVSIDGSKTLEVSVQGWLRPDLLAKSTLQTLAGSDQTPKSQSNLTEAAAPTKAPPTAKSSQATPIPPPVPGSYSVIVELADAKLIFTSADALKFTRPGEADAKSPPLEAARNPGRLITLQIAAAAGPSASLIAFPFPVQQQPSNLFEITPTDGAMVSVEESDNREFGWIASRLLTSDGKSLLPLPRFPKKFYRITLRPVSATKDSKSAP